MDNKVVKIENMQGWRKSSGEELQMIQGLLLDQTLREGKATRKIDFISGFSIILVIAGIVKLGKGVPAVVEKRNYLAIAVLGMFIIAAIALIYQLGKNLFNHLKYKPVKGYIRAVKNGDFRVLDVEIAKAVQAHDGFEGVDGHYVKVQDMHGNTCDREFIIKFVNSYNGKEAILVEIVSKSVEKPYLLVLPKKNTSISTWEKGLKLYQKYMK